MKVGDRMEIEKMSDSERKQNIVQLLRLLFRIKAEEVKLNFENALLDEEIESAIVELRCYDTVLDINTLKPAILRK